MGWTSPPKTWADGNTIPEGDLNTHVRDQFIFLKENILLEEADELTISAGGSVTATKSYHKIDTFGDAATDDLDAIGGGTEGRILILRAENTARTVVLKNSAGIVLGGDISLDDTSKHVALICDSAGIWHLLDSAKDVTFMANAFQYPAPGTDWTSDLKGAGLAASLTTKKVWLPLNFLKIGDGIIGYKLVGDAVEAAALTLDCKLVRVNLADPLTTTDVAGGGIVQIAANGNFDSAATLTAVEIVATDKQYTLEILGTTGVGDTIVVMGAEVLIRRLA